MRYGSIKSAEDIIEFTDKLGFLPFFKNDIEGLSIEELCAPSLWFSSEQDGPWEWKGPVARSKTCIYGKFFGGKAGFVSRELVPDLANVRRDGYDFESRMDEGIAPYADERIFLAVKREGEIASKRLKRMCELNKGFDGAIARLQAETYVCISDFIYERDKYGKQYGWGVAVYSTPEDILGENYVRSAYKLKPAQSAKRLLERLTSTLSGVDEARLKELILPRNMRRTQFDF